MPRLTSSEPLFITTAGAIRQGPGRLQRSDPARPEVRLGVCLQRADFMNPKAISTRPWPTTTKRSGSIRKSAWAYAARGNLYAAKGDFDKALADYNEAIRLDPKLVHAYLCRANAYKAQGNSDKALDDLNEAIRIDPNNSWAYNDELASTRPEVT